MGLRFPGLTNGIAPGLRSVIRLGGLHGERQRRTANVNNPDFVENKFGGQPDNYWEHSGIGVMGP